MKEDNMPYRELYLPGEQQGGNQRKRYDGQIFGPCQRTKMAVEHVSPCSFPTTITIKPRAPLRII